MQLCLKGYQRGPVTLEMWTNYRNKTCISSSIEHCLSQTSQREKPSGDYLEECARIF